MYVYLMKQRHSYNYYYYYFLLKEFLLMRVIYFHFLNSLRLLLLWPSQEAPFEGGTFSLFCLFHQRVKQYSLHKQYSSSNI